MRLEKELDRFTGSGLEPTLTHDKGLDQGASVPHRADRFVAIEEPVYEQADVVAGIGEEPDRAIEKDMEERFELVGDLDSGCGISERIDRLKLPSSLNRVSEIRNPECNFMAHSSIRVARFRLVVPDTFR